MAQLDSMIPTAFIALRTQADIDNYSALCYLMPIQQWPFSAIPVSDSDFNPQNTQCISPVKIFVVPDVAKTVSFLDG
jgi:hypothetical protein